MRLFPLLFIILPIAEMWLLIEVGAEIGALNTIVLVLLTAVIGFALLRQQGLATLARAQQRMAEGQIPAAEMAEGICLAVGGALLLTPGFITDVFGFVCLLPGLRKLLIGGVLKRMQQNQQSGFTAQAQYHQSAAYSSSITDFEPNSGSTKRPTVIEGEFQRDTGK